MTESALIIENLSKVYRIGSREEKHDSIGRSVVEFIKSPVKNYLKYRSLYKFSDEVLYGDYEGDDILWALRDVSFEVKQGEVVGIIGVNGAGKSTLLKVISRITPPTKGRITIRGRVSSLLEVGTGFHQELTGRENVYLNGTILGMRKREVDRKFDEIVDFSGVEKFLDTPVKRYSMGMRVRLASAVAAHLEPEILIRYWPSVTPSSKKNASTRWRMLAMKVGRSCLCHTIWLRLHDCAVVASCCRRVALSPMVKHTK